MLRGEETSSISKLIALKPRQVLIAEQKQKLEPRSTMAKKQLKEQPKEETDTPKAELNLALFHSVIKYVHDKGFAKTFKRFLKEARVEDDAWKADSFDLEEMYRGCLEKCRDGDTKFKGQKEQEQSAFNTMEKDADGDKDAPVETISKKKKKKKKKISEENDDNAKSAICELKTDESTRNQIDKKKKKNTLTSESNDENGTCKESLHDVTQRIPETFETMVSNDTTKSKDKSKKQKIETVSPLEDVKRAENVVSRDKNAADFPMDDGKTKSKEKKKKKKDALSEKLADNGVENKGKSEETFDNVADKESKKRKRSDSDENKVKPVEEAAVEESKRRKSEVVKEAKVAVEVNTVLGGNGEVGGENKEENFTQKSTSVEQFDINTKGDLSNGVQKSSALRSAKKQRNGSTEPKTVNAFQRVKVDAVEFADERLQNNSYWAKEGAETGYGAKAEEVLGQVKGRDFRHEKTKKKRGSYRGGLIDLQSHSVKFNYSDEE